MWSICSRNGSLDDESGEIFAPRRQQGRHQERPPENQGRDPQCRVRPQAARGRLKQGATPVSKVEARGAIDQVMGSADQGVKIGDSLAWGGRGLRQASNRRRPRDKARPAARPAGPWAAAVPSPTRAIKRSSSCHADSRCSSRSATLIGGHLDPRFQITITIPDSADRLRSKHRIIRPRKSGDRRRRGRRRRNTGRRARTAFSAAVASGSAISARRSGPNRLRAST